MIIDYLLFGFLAVIAIVSALGMLLSRNAVYSALNLILNFGTVAVLYLVLGAPFIALAQITVYAGAIMVLFLFVIMLLGAEKLPLESALPWQRPIAIISGVALLILALYTIIIRSSAPLESAALLPGYGSPQNVGENLFLNYMLPFEAVSVLLLVAMVGAIVLTRKKEQEK